jgi:hypothetical protein
LLHSSMHRLLANELHRRQCSFCIYCGVQDGTEVREFSLHSFAGLNSSNMAGQLSLHFEFVSVGYKNPKPINRAIQVCRLPEEQHQSDCVCYLGLITSPAQIPTCRALSAHARASPDLSTANVHIIILPTHERPQVRFRSRCHACIMHNMRAGVQQAASPI